MQSTGRYAWWRVIDLHAHLLPGIDDGPAGMRDSLAMARAAVAAGTTTMACTPHLAPKFPTAVPQIVEGVARMRQAVADAGIDLDVRPGGEIALDWLPRLGDADLRAVSLGGGGRWLLLEMPFRGWPLRLPEMLTALEVRGFNALLAHPERAESVQASPDRMRDLVGRGALVQITAASLAGDNGPVPRRTAITLLRSGFAHVISSDAHSASWRPPGLDEGLAAAAAALRVEGEALRWMVDDVPRAIIQGDVVRPPRLNSARTPPAAARPAPSGPPRRTRRSP